MQIKIQAWSIQELIDKKGDINPKPQYQRTEVWTQVRKQNLIDSILKGYDLPKFYVKFFKDKKDGFEFEVTDGQQRMRAIWDFVDNMYPLPKGTKINGHDLSGLRFSQLSNDFKNHILNFDLTFSEILQGTNADVNELFARLQQGVSLNPAELRNAIPSIMGTEIKKLTTHPFFINSKIDDRRFKHQEYLDNIFALAYYHNNKDLKAKAMSELYVELSDSDPSTSKAVKDLAATMKKNLDILQKINAIRPGLFKNKWGFVDAINFINNIPTGKKLDIALASQKFSQFETLRLKYTGKPELLLDATNPDANQDLYTYINAFNKDGALKTNIRRRHDVLNRFLAGAIK